MPPGRVGAPPGCRRDLQGSEDPADGRCADPVAKLEQLSLDPLVSPARFSMASRSISAAISALTGGRPTRCGQVQWRATRRRCQRRTVPGVTSRCVRSRGGRSRISAARTARSAQSNRGRGWVRRSTATSCHSTSSSAFFDAADRLSRTSQPQSRTKMRYSRRKDTDDHDALRLALAIIAGQRHDTVLTPHRLISARRPLRLPATAASSSSPARPPGSTDVILGTNARATKCPPSVFVPDAVVAGPQDAQGHPVPGDHVADMGASQRGSRRRIISASAPANANSTHFAKAMPAFEPLPVAMKAVADFWRDPAFWSGEL